jgi:GT2 family glycosyltransferase
MGKLPIVAAVPNYNMGEQLSTLLPTLLDKGYDEVYVLDDGSTDDSREVTTDASTDIHFVADGSNRGAGATRNRIIPALGSDALIHFIDADTSVDTERSAEVVADSVPNEAFGFVGGLAKNEDGTQTVWNFGPRQCLWTDLGAQVQARLEPLVLSEPEKAKQLRERSGSLMQDWPNPLEEPLRRQVYWVIEQNFIVQASMFKAFGGFDEKLREHEIQDLAIRMGARGLSRYFDPSFATTHKAIDVRGYDRGSAMARAELQIARKHGLRNWLLPDGKFRPGL